MHNYITEVNVQIRSLQLKPSEQKETKEKKMPKNYKKKKFHLEGKLQKIIQQFWASFAHL